MSTFVLARLHGINTEIFVTLKYNNQIILIVG